MVVDHLWDVVDEYWLCLVDAHGPHDAYQIGREAWAFMKDNPKYQAFERTREKNDFKFMRSCSSRPTEDGRFVDELVPTGNPSSNKSSSSGRKNSSGRDEPAPKKPRRPNPYYAQEEAHERRDFREQPSCVQDNHEEEEEDIVNMNLDEDSRRDVIGQEAYAQEHEDRLRQEAMDSVRPSVYSRLGKGRK